MPKNDHPRWPQLVEAISVARVRTGLTSWASWAREAGVDTNTVKRVAGELRDGVNITDGTLDKATTKALGMPQDEWRRILEEGARPSADPIRAASDTVLLDELRRRAHEREHGGAAAAG